MIFLCNFMKEGGEDNGYDVLDHNNEFPVRNHRILFLAVGAENGQAGEETGEERRGPGETGISHG